MKRIKSSIGKVSIIIPTINEEKTIAKVLKETSKYVDEILVVDGRSHDETVTRVKGLGVSVITQKGFGKGAALREAFGEIDGDLILIMDADASMRPKEIRAFVESMEDGVDLVKGSRFLPGGGSEDLNCVRIIGNMLFTNLVNFLWHTNYTDLCYGFAAFRKETAEKLFSHLRARRFEIETEIVIKATKLGLKVREIPSFELKRGYGKSNLNIIRDGLRILAAIIQEFMAGNNNLQ